MTGRVLLVDDLDGADRGVRGVAQAGVWVLVFQQARDLPDLEILELGGIEERTGGLWNDIIDPKDEGLKTTAQFIRDSTDRKIMTFVNVNNHYEGCAPLTIQRLLELL